ncbi:EAL domain-containing protein, partial [Candidatus Bipolaricaulota bacterium]|nr:EAL domain-containing protein [Candidatus Bipolaricaulota bacterium]
EGEKGGVIGAVVSVTDRTGQRELEEKLEYFRTHDRLTGLINHRKFRKLAEEELASSSAPSTGLLLLLDVDRLKEVNDSFGVEAGDRLLVGLAEFLKEQLPESGILARFGGDEFIGLIPGPNEEGAEELVVDIVKGVREQEVPSPGANLQATASLGYATYPRQGNTASELLAKADIALHQAKASGRNQFKAYKPDYDARGEVESRVDWAMRINEAIRRDDFLLYAQPILELGTDRVSHYEILVRMSQGENELISPGKFLPVAEKFGLSRDIDKWVVSKALDSFPEAGKGNLDHQFAINLSGQSMTDGELLNWLETNRSLREGSFEQILFEVTETAAVSNIDLANDFISTLKDRGSQFALDDFGMGFSSFNYLKELSVDYLKIDGSFIQDLPRNSMNQNLVRSIVEVAHRLKKETIAEFVEDEETLQMVKNYGSDHAQGYYIGRPEPLGELV